MQETQALPVDEHPYPVALDDFVARLGSVETHPVLQARAASLVDEDAQARVGGCVRLVGEEGAEMFDGGIRDRHLGKGQETLIV